MKSIHPRLTTLALAGLLSAGVAGQALAAAAGFKAYDSNGDGTISLQEFEAQGGQARVFQDGDANRDSALSQDEFAQAVAIGDREQAGKYVDDAWLTTKVKTLLLKDEGLKGLAIKVATHKGTVQLAGWVNDPMQIAQAEKIARGVEGVTGVKNDLQIKH